MASHERERLLGRVADLIVGLEPRERAHLSIDNVDTGRPRVLQERLPS